MKLEQKMLPSLEHNEESMFLSFITLRRKYKERSNQKNWIIEDYKLPESFLHKGISPEVIIRRRGVLNRFKKLTGWKSKIQTISIIKIVLLSYHGQGAVEDLIDISQEN